MFAWRRLDLWDVLLVVAGIAAGGAGFIAGWSSIDPIRSGLVLGLCALTVRRLVSPSVADREREAPPGVVGSSSLLSLLLFATGGFVVLVGVIAAAIVVAMMTEKPPAIGPTWLLPPLAVILLGIALIKTGRRLRRGAAR